MATGTDTVVTIKIPIAAFILYFSLSSLPLLLSIIAAGRCAPAAAAVQAVENQPAQYIEVFVNNRAV